MSKTVAIIITVALLIGCGVLIYNIKDAYKVLPMKTNDELVVPAFVDWRKFVAQTGKFEVLLPVVPQYAKEAVAIPGTNQKRYYEMYASEKMNGTIFMISLITYPNEIDTSNTDVMLHGIVDEMVSAKPENRIRFIEDSVFQDRPAVKFAIQSKNIDINGVVFMIDKTVYVLNYVASVENFAESEYNYFLDSFKLLPKAFEVAQRRI